MGQKTASQVGDLARRAADGDQQAWDALVTQYSGLLWSVVRRFRLGEQQSADVVQTTWLRLLENIRLIRDPARLPGWLVVTARNLSVEAVRYAGRSRPLDDDYESPITDERPEVAVLRFERETLVRQALRRLSERDQELLTLVVASPPIPYEEISVRLGMPVGSIGPTRMRALRRLRAELEHSGVVDVGAY
jgi:RNA polymerase sigma factor (sigma-70 family)